MGSLSVVEGHYAILEPRRPAHSAGRLAASACQEASLGEQINTQVPSKKAWIRSKRLSRQK